MSFAAVEKIVQALLYDGYLLYPYRPSALKNRQRWLFGRLLPREFSIAHDETEAWKIQTECLIRSTPSTELEVRVRFLQLMESDKTNGDAVWNETVERDVPVTVNLERITSCPARFEFSFPPQLEGAVTLSAEQSLAGVFKLTVCIENLSSGVAGQDLDRALYHSLLSTHTLLRIVVHAARAPQDHTRAACTTLRVQQDPTRATFISLLDPPETYRTIAASCRNNGSWPVLIGSEPGRMMLSSPIILYDYPQVAPESPGDLFDNTEIDELLSLRIQTLTEAEKEEMSASNERARTVLERTDALTEHQLLNLHGRLRRGRESFSGDPQPVQDLVAEKDSRPPFQPGDRVRLRPRHGADALDLLLGGQTATIVSVQQDFEDGIHLGVVMDDDPGRDFGEQGLPGHRFFYRPDEVDRL
jgi:hypothetical protein